MSRILLHEETAPEAIKDAIVESSKRLFANRLDIQQEPDNGGERVLVIRYISASRIWAKCSVQMRMSDPKVVTTVGNTNNTRTGETAWAEAANMLESAFALWLWLAVTMYLRGYLGGEISNWCDNDGEDEDWADFHLGVDDLVEDVLGFGPVADAMLAKQIVYAAVPPEFQPIQYSRWQRVVRSIRAWFK